MAVYDWDAWTITYYPRKSVAGTSIDLLGNSARGVVRVHALGGFHAPDALYIATPAVGYRGSQIQDVTASVPLEMRISGRLTDPAGDHSGLLRQYATLLDARVVKRPASATETGLIVYGDGTITYQRDAVVKSFQSPREIADTPNARAFELILETYDPVWRSAALNTTVLNVGSNTFNVNSAWETYPIIRVTPTGTGVSNVSITSATHDNRGVTINSSYSPGSAVVIDMNPLNPDLVLVGTSKQDQYLGYTDRRFALWNGSNQINVSCNGTATFTIEWFDLFPGV